MKTIRMISPLLMILIFLSAQTVLAQSMQHSARAGEERPIAVDNDTNTNHLRDCERLCVAYCGLVQINCHFDYNKDICSELHYIFLDIIDECNQPCACNFA